jgi:tetratricopeptide (TPR) repeat protein
MSVWNRLFGGGTGRDSDQYAEAQQDAYAFWSNHLRQAEQLYFQGQHDKAVAAAQFALSFATLSFGKTHYTVALSLIKLAGMYSEMSKYREAEDHYLQALEVLGPAPTENSPVYGRY